MMAVTSRPIDLTRAFAIDGFMSAVELEWLATHAQTADRIIEVGCWQGRSTRALADHCLGVVYAIDAWEQYEQQDPAGAAWLAAQSSWPAARAAFATHLADHLATGRVVQLPLLATVAAQTLRQDQGVGWADLVFIDADHREFGIAADLIAYRPLMRPGGILAGHDYGHPEWPSIARVVDQIWPQGVHCCESIWWVRL